MTPFGRTSELSLRFVGPRLAKLHFTAPFKVMRPFAAKGRQRLVVMKSSAGLMAGDEERIHITAARGARAEVTSQSFEKIHRMEAGVARRELHIQVEAGAALFYTPLPTLPFGDSCFTGETAIDLARGAKLFFSDILACGRAAFEAPFSYRRYASRIRLRQEGELLYYDNTLFAPREMDMGGICLYEGYTHLATFLLMGTLDVEDCRALLAPWLEAPSRTGGVTRLAEEAGAVLVRLLARSAEELLAAQALLLEAAASPSA